MCVSIYRKTNTSSNPASNWRNLCLPACLSFHFLDNCSSDGLKNFMCISPRTQVSAVWTVNVFGWAVHEKDKKRNIKRQSLGAGATHPCSRRQRLGQRPGQSMDSRENKLQPQNLALDHLQFGTVLDRDPGSVNLKWLITTEQLLTAIWSESIPDRFV